MTNSCDEKLMNYANHSENINHTDSQKVSAHLVDQTFGTIDAFGT